MDQKEINDLKNAGSLTFDEDAGEELLKKIQEGTKKSENLEE